MSQLTLVEDGIPFASMTGEHLISRLSHVESNPPLLWSLLSKYFGQDFFLEEIEREYGVSSESSDKLLKMIHSQLAHLRQAYEGQVAELEVRYGEQVAIARKQVGKTADE